MLRQAQLDSVSEVSAPGLAQLGQRAALARLHSGRIKARQGGEYQSGFKGRGMEFDESRLYQPGDDMRNIDWRVTARTGKPHTKLFREERERPVFLLLDLRKTMFFATQGRFKSVLAAQLASILAWSALRHGDRIGGLIFSDSEHHEIKPQRGKTAALRLINQIAGQHKRHGPNSQDNNARRQSTQDHALLHHALLRLRRLARPGSLIFLLSDFRQLNKAAAVQLSRLGKHNDITLLFIYDRLEGGLPPAGYYKLTDGAAELMLDTRDRGLVAAYQRQFDDRLQQLQSLARSNRMRLLHCHTCDHPVALSGQCMAEPIR